MDVNVLNYHKFQTFSSILSYVCTYKYVKHFVYSFNNNRKKKERKNVNVKYFVSYFYFIRINFCNCSRFHFILFYVNMSFCFLFAKNDNSRTLSLFLSCQKNIPQKKRIKRVVVTHSKEIYFICKNSCFSYILFASRFQFLLFIYSHTFVCSL